MHIGNMTSHKKTASILSINKYNYSNSKKNNDLNRSNDNISIMSRNS